MTTQITGIDPTGKPRIYAINAPDGAVAEYLARAEADGWTGLVHESVQKQRCKQCHEIGWHRMDCTVNTEQPAPAVPKRPQRRRRT